MFLRFDLGCSQVPGPQCRTRLKERKLARQGSPVRMTLTLPLKPSAVSHWVSRSAQYWFEYGWLSRGNLVFCDPGDCEAGGAATGRVGSLLASGL